MPAFFIQSPVSPAKWDVHVFPEAQTVSHEEADEALHSGNSTQACQDVADDWYRPW